MGVPAKRKLTPLQERFVEHLVVDGLRPQAAAEEAGYSPGKGAKGNAYKNLKLPHVLEHLNKRMMQEFGATAALALGTVRSLATSARSEHVKLEASKDLLDRAGFKPIDRAQVQVAGDVRVSIDLGD
jgi:phage terminase small subunit